MVTVKNYVPTPKGLKYDEDYRLLRTGNFSGFHEVVRRWNLANNDLLFILRWDKKTDEKISGSIAGYMLTTKLHQEIYEVLEDRYGRGAGYIKVALAEMYLASGYTFPYEDFKKYASVFSEDTQEVYAEIYE